MPQPMLLRKKFEACQCTAIGRTITANSTALWVCCVRPRGQSGSLRCTQMQRSLAGGIRKGAHRQDFSSR